MHWIILISCLFIACSNIGYTQQISDYHYRLNAQGWPWSIPDEDKTTILLMGDTHIQARHDPRTVWVHLLPTLQSADIRILNLEGALFPPSNDINRPDIPHKNFWRHSEPRNIMAYTHADITAVGVANNVAYPPEALLQSLKILDSAGINYAGGGQNLMEAWKPLIMEKNGVKIGFMQFTTLFWPENHAADEKNPGVAAIKVETKYQPAKTITDKPGEVPVIVTNPDKKDLKRLEQVIGNIKQQIDFVIASFHWGISGKAEIVGYEQVLAHHAIDAGADFIMGHGNHLVQAVEEYRGKPIFYGLGNSAFDWRRVTDKRDGLLVRIIIQDKQLKQVSFLPLTRDGENDPVLLDPNKDIGQKLYRQVEELSLKYGTVLTIEGHEVVVQNIKIINEE